MYALGQGVAKDSAEAARWYRKAAEQGHAAAQKNLGVMYAHGEGVPQDYAEAYKWANLAAAGAVEPGRKAGELVEVYMSPRGTAEAQRSQGESRPRTTPAP
jgi:TPR repeat protein